MTSQTMMPISMALAAAILLAIASPASAQSASDERNFVFMGTSATTVVMVSSLPATPPREPTEVWVWHLSGPNHPRSTPAGTFGRAVRMSIDCTDRSSLSLEAEMYLGVTRSYRTNLRSSSQRERPRSDTIGAYPIEAVCDPTPARPRPVYADLAAARVFADRVLAQRPIAP